MADDAPTRKEAEMGRLTPRVDALLGEIWSSLQDTVHYVPPKMIDLARQLERELRALSLGEAPSYESIMETLPSVLSNASAQCPLCGQLGVHQHTPQEIVIYRNGVKYGRALQHAPTRVAEAELGSVVLVRNETLEEAAKVYDGIQEREQKYIISLRVSGIGIAKDCAKAIRALQHGDQHAPARVAQARVAELEKALWHILWIKDCGIDGTDETGTFRNWPETERDTMYDIAKAALKSSP